MAIFVLLYLFKNLNTVYINLNIQYSNIWYEIHSFLDILFDIGGFIQCIKAYNFASQLFFCNEYMMYHPQRLT